MRGEVRVPMESARVCAAAVEAIGRKRESRRGVLYCSCSGSEFVAVVEASDFTALRAYVTSLLRDLRVFLDSLQVVGKSNGRK